MGKSSLINSLIRTKSAETGDRPGVTRCLQELKLDKGVTLLDTPGVVFDTDGNAGAIGASVMRNSIAIDKVISPHPLDLREG